MSLQLLLLLGFLLPLLGGSSSSSSSGGKFVILQVKSSGIHSLDVGEEADQQAEAYSVSGENSFSAEIFHRESPAFSKNQSTQFSILDRLRRDALRSRAIASAISLATSGFRASDLTTLASPNHEKKNSSRRFSFSSPLISGIAGGSGDYFARIGVGTPARSVYMVADTGSDISWLQCTPCRRCYEQQDPIFNPSGSSSFKPIQCRSPICSQLRIKSCNPLDHRCVYQVSYGDGSFTLGDFSTERLTFGQHSVSEVAIGCGRNNQGLFHGAAGLLGLGRGSLSFPSQNGKDFSGVFSYCLPRRESSKPAQLVFGARSVPSSARFTPLVVNKRLETYYYVSLEEIRVAGEPVRNIPADAFRVGSRGDGGVIVDSGTAITRLTSPAYGALRDAFVAALGDELPVADGISLFDTCFDLSGRSTARLPAVELGFEGGAAMELPAEGILVNVDDEGTYCLAFAPEEEGFSIIGNVQQQTFRISIDNRRHRMGIAPHQCN